MNTHCFRPARFTVVGLLLLAASVNSCRLALPPPPVRPVETDPLEQAVVAEPAGVPSDLPSPFLLHAGDVLRLRSVSRAPLEVERLVVDAAGAVSIPMAGNVTVGGLSLPRAEHLVEEAMHEFDRYARVQLSLVESAGQAATVVGAVARPGRYPLSPGLRLAELLALAGGPKTSEVDSELVDAADVAAGRLVREGEPLPVSMTRALQGERGHNVWVRAGDLLYLPPARGRRISVLGEVKSARSLVFRPGLRLSEALAMAGGPTRDADDTDVRLLRGPLSAPRVYSASLRAFTRGEAPDVLLAAGDIVFVTEHWFAGVAEVLRRLTPLIAVGALTSAVVR